MLVLSKVYLVTKGALVPEMAALGMLDEPTGGPGSAETGTAGVTAGTLAEPEEDGLRPFPCRDPVPSPPYGTPVIRIEDPGTGVSVVEPDLATLNARLGLLASLAGFVFAVPAVISSWAAAQRDLGEHQRVRRRRRGRGAITAGAPAPGLGPGLPGGAAGVPGVRRHHARGTAPDARRRRGDGSGLRSGMAATIGGFRRSPALRRIPGVLLALMPMVLKALVGFSTFLFAFGACAGPAATWWFGFVLGGLTAGALIGVLSEARIRRYLDEQQMLIGSLLLVAVVTVVGAFYTPRWFWAMIALVVGLASAGRRSTPWSSATSVSPTRAGPSPGSRPGSSSCGWWGRSCRWCCRCPWRPGAWSWPWWPPWVRCPT